MNCTLENIMLKHVILLSLISSVLLLELKPLGEHSEPSGGATMLPGKFPPPGVFYWHFVKPGKPLLMKDVLNITKVPAYTQWTDDNLKFYYGREFVGVEEGKKENRDSPMRTMKLGKFIEIYQKSDMFLVDDVPTSMQEEVSVPSCLYCGGFQNQVHGSILWFSSGGTKSVLHYDGSDNINCLMDGTKEVILIDKAYKHLIENDDFNEARAYSYVDVDAVDPGKFPGVASAPWHKVTMMKGDCLFIPYKWYHQVHSPPGRNLAVNFWFSHIWWFNSSDCNMYQVPTLTTKSLNNLKKQSNEEHTRTYFLEPLSGADPVSKELFLEKVECDNEQQTLKLFHFINKNNDHELTWEELYSLDMKDVFDSFRDCLKGDIDLHEEANEKSDMDEEEEEEEEEKSEPDTTIEDETIIEEKDRSTDHDEL